MLPGHGEPIDDHVALIDERFALHERRARKIGRLIAERPRSAYEIAQALWGNVAVTQAYLTLSEVLGHVDLLLDRGEVREAEVGRRRPLRGGVAVDEVELVLISLLVAVAGLGAISRALGIPYPIVLVVGGLALGFVPGLPDVELEPDLVLVIFLPPLLYSAAFFANLRDLKADLRGDLAAGHRPRGVDRGRGRRRRARGDRRPAVGGGLRARRDRRADRPGRGHRDRPAPGRSRADRSTSSRARA